MNGATLQTLDLGAIRMRVATQVDNQPVLLCQGFPENLHTWRRHLRALAAARYRAAAPDRRGYGGIYTTP